MVLSEATLQYKKGAKMPIGLKAKDEDGNTVVVNYTYNKFGIIEKEEYIFQPDNSKFIVNYVYNKQHLIIKKTENNNKPEISSYVYDRLSNWIKKTTNDLYQEDLKIVIKRTINY